MGLSHHQFLLKNSFPIEESCLYWQDVISVSHSPIRRCSKASSINCKSINCNTNIIAFNENSSFSINNSWFLNRNIVTYLPKHQVKRRICWFNCSLLIVNHTVANRSCWSHTVVRTITLCWAGIALAGLRIARTSSSHGSGGPELTTYYLKTISHSENLDSNRFIKHWILAWEIKKTQMSLLQPSNEESCIKSHAFVFKNRDFVFKMMSYVLKMLNWVDNLWV